MRKPSDLAEAMQAVCPILWMKVSVGRKPKYIEWGLGATEQQKAQALAIADSFDWNARTQRDDDDDELKRLKALPHNQWQASDIKSAVQIWVSRQ